MRESDEFWERSRSREERIVRVQEEEEEEWYSQICMLGSAKETTGSFSVRRLWLPARAQVGDANVLSLPHADKSKICTCTWSRHHSCTCDACAVPACLCLRTQRTTQCQQENALRADGKALESLSSIQERHGRNVNLPLNLRLYISWWFWDSEGFCG